MAEGGLRKIGQYEIVGLLGRGGMANVYRAIQPSMENREVAIKVLPATFSQDEAFLERFQREIRLVARLQHPRILPVYDSGEQGGLPYIVMALMGGGTLSERIHDAPDGMPLAETARLVEQMAEGLDYAHRQGVIHRDFKPSNVLLDTEGNVHLTDFGIAKAAAETAHLTGTGVIGTPAYMAPELSNPNGLSPLVDIYALGVTVYQMLTGQQPYGAETPLGMMVAHVTQPIPDVRKYRADLPTDAQVVILRAMAKDPAQRYQTAKALADDLKTLAAGMPMDRTDVVRDLPPQPSRGGRDTARRSSILMAPLPEDEFQPTPLPSSTQNVPQNAPQKKRRRRAFALPIGWLVALVVCLVAVIVAALAGAASLPSLAGFLPGGPTATAAQVVLVVTSTPAPTIPPSPGPAVTRVRFCDRPCDQSGAQDVTSYPDNTAFVYVSVDFTQMKHGAHYSREWRSRGEPWVHYDCQWLGDPDMHRLVTLRDSAGGLRAGEWTMIIAIDGHEVSKASVTVNGSNNNWNPFTPVTQPCPDWK